MSCWDRTCAPSVVCLMQNSCCYERWRFLCFCFCQLTDGMCGGGHELRRIHPRNDEGAQEEASKAISKAESDRRRGPAEAKSLRK